MVDTQAKQVKKHAVARCTHTECVTHGACSTPLLTLGLPHLRAHSAVCSSTHEAKCQDTVYACLRVSCSWPMGLPCLPPTAKPAVLSVCLRLNISSGRALTWQVAWSWHASKVAHKHAQTTSKQRDFPTRAEVRMAAEGVGLSFRMGRRTRRGQRAFPTLPVSLRLSSHLQSRRKVSIP